jgi:hypothetical protein
LKAVYNSQRHSPSHPTRRDSLPRLRQTMRRMDRFLAAHPEAVAKARARVRRSGNAVEG